MEAPRIERLTAFWSVLYFYNYDGSQNFKLSIQSIAVLHPAILEIATHEQFLNIFDEWLIAVNVIETQENFVNKCTASNLQIKSKMGRSILNQR